MLEISGERYMADKIRVFELARDLRMKSKTLLEKLNNMNIQVNSHITTLGDLLKR